MIFIYSSSEIKTGHILLISAISFCLKIIQNNIKTEYKINQAIPVGDSSKDIPPELFKPPHEKTNNVHRRKQRRTSAFATWIVQFLFFLNPKFRASKCLLWPYSPICVRPVQKPHCLFSHDVALLWHRP